MSSSFNFSSDEVKDTMRSSFYQSSEEIREFCDPCGTEGKKKEAIFYCHNCTESLCGDCREFHRKVSATKNHNVSRIDESKTASLQSGNADDISKSFKNITLDGATGNTHAEQTSGSVKPFRKATLTNRLNVSMEDDDKPCAIYGVLVQDNLIYLADFSNGKIKLFDLTGHAIAQYSKRYVFDLTSIRKDTIACTSCSKYFTIIAKEENTLKLVKTITTSLYTKGIAYYNGFIYVSMGTKEESHPQIQVFSPDGELKRRIEPIMDGEIVLKITSRLSINQRKGTVYVSDFRVGIIAISSAGKVLFVKKVFDKTETALGISIDDQGQVYICGTNTNNVMTMSADGSDVSEIINKECDSAIAIETVGNQMYLCCRDTDIVRVFTLA